MDRLLVLRLRSHGVGAEALLNGVPLARTPKGGGDVALPVHEYVVAGPNRLELLIDPPPAAQPAPPAAPLVGDDRARAEAALLLPRIGILANETVARVLVQTAWAASDGEVYPRPVAVANEADIPVRFPRWRWLDAPPIDQPETLREPAAAYLQDLAIAFARGDAEPMLMAARLRFEEIAAAYQRSAADDAARWRSRVQLLHAQKAMRPPLPTPETLRLRPVAGARLLECLLDDGRPALRCTRPDGSQVYWPMRLAAVERRLYPLR